MGTTAGSDRRFEAPVTKSAEWDLIVEGGADIDYQVVVQGVSEGNVVFTKAYRGTIRPGQRFSTKMNVNAVTASVLYRF